MIRWFLLSAFVENGIVNSLVCYEEMNEMRLRKQALGTRNMVGARVEMARKNHEKHNPLSPLISGKIEDDDKVNIRNVKSNIDGQLQLFW